MTGIVNTGGSSAGGILTVIAPEGSTIEVVKGNRKYVKTGGTAIFRGLETGEWTVTIKRNEQIATQKIEINANYELVMAYFNATIVTTFPTDCTSVTCTKGDIVFSVPSGSLSSGEYTFNIPEVGEWVLYATNGTKEKSVTVSVIEEKAYTVDIKFTLVLYDSGSEYPESTGEWSVTSSSGEYADACEITKNAKNMVFFAGYHSTASFSHSKPIDMSKYATLHILGKFDDKSTGESGTAGISTSNSGEEFNASVSMSGDSGNVQRDVDLSNVNTNAYFKIYMKDTCQFTASKIWLD